MRAMEMGAVRAVRSEGQNLGCVVAEGFALPMSTHGGE